MAKDPRRLGPAVPRLAHPKEAHVPVEVALHVLRGHAGEAPEAPLQPGAEVSHGLHALEIHLVTHVGLVGLGDR